MRITVLAGGVGGSRFVRGFLDAIGRDDDVSVVNTADDAGCSVCGCAPIWTP